MLSPPISRAGVPRNATFQRSRVAPTNATEDKTKLPTAPVQHFNSDNNKRFNTVLPTDIGLPTTQPRPAKQLHDLNTSELQYSVNSHTLLFTEYMYEVEYMKQQNYRYDKRLYQLLVSMFVIISIDLAFTLADYTTSSYDKHDMLTKVILQCFTMGCVILLPLHMYTRQHYGMQAQSVLLVQLGSAGILWAISANYYTTAYVAQSYTILGYVAVLSVFGSRIMYYITLALTVALINILYLIFAIYYIVTTPSNVFNIEQVYSICIMLLTSAALLYNAHTKESLKRYLFVCELKVEYSRKTNFLLKNEAMEMRGHMYVMTLEHYNIADLVSNTAGVNRESLMSPMELAMEKLQNICQTQQQTLHKDVFLDLQKIISWLGSSSDVFKPKISEAIADGNMQIDKETERWINGIVGDDEQEADGDDLTMHNLHVDTVNNGRETSPSPAHAHLPRQSVDHTLLSVRGNNSDNSSLSRQFSQFSQQLNSTVQTADEKLFNELMNGIDLWDFDVFEIANLTKNKPLLFIGTALFKRYNLLNIYKIDKAKLTNFLNVIENGYSKTCPYHNSIHAADVVRSVHFFIQKKHKQYINENEIFSVIFASIIHDYNHAGLNNNFYINTKNPLAILYNDRSVLENMHSAKSFELCMKHENNIFENVDKTTYATLRKLIIELVLATDLALHFDILGQFKNVYNTNNLVDNYKNEKNRLLILKMALKCGDLNHSAKTLLLHQKWSNRIAEEFYRQGDEERKLGIPISPFMDRQKTNLPKSQLGFLDFLVIPLFSVYCKYLDINNDNELPCMSNVNANREYWDKLNQENEHNQKALTDSNSTKK